MGAMRIAGWSFFGRFAGTTPHHYAERKILVLVFVLGRGASKDWRKKRKSHSGFCTVDDLPARLCDLYAKLKCERCTRSEA